MANATEWTQMLNSRGWIDGSGLITAPPDSVLRVSISDSRSYAIRGGKSGAEMKIQGEFLLVSEYNVDTSGRSRVTTIAVSALQSIDSVA